MSAFEQLLRQLADPSETPWNEETYDLALARALDGQERAAYVARLLENAERGDTRAILTLGHLRAYEALPRLAADAKSGEPWAATARRALVLFGEGAEVVEEIARDAVSSPAKMARVAAIMDLPKIGGATALLALQRALVDEDSDVRVIAWDALVEALGLTKHLQSPEGRRELTTEVEVLRVLLASDIAALVKVGAEGMREVARRSSAGATAREVGAAWRPRSAEPTFHTLRAAMYGGGALPIDALKALEGADRRLVEVMIARRLEDRDARVPDALVALDAAWTAPALQELAGSNAVDPALRAKLALAARALAAT